VVGGYANGEIAEKCSISIKTVKHHLTNIFDKLGVANRLERAVRRAPPARKRLCNRSSFPPSGRQLASKNRCE
jgi:hypothetical protein